MAINSVTGQVTATQTQELEKKTVEQAKQDVSFWSSDWNAGNLVRETIGWDALAKWLDDSDKVCTDGKDDGKLGIGETLEHAGKGLAGLVKGIMNHPIASGVAIAAGIGATMATGGAILPALAAIGGTIGAGMVGIGAYNAATAETDAEAKQAWETIGTGVFVVGASAVSAKPALDAASKAGVTSAQGAKDMSTGEAFVQTFKTLPEALKVSGQNIKGNVSTLTTGLVHPYSNEGRRLAEVARIQEKAILEAEEAANIVRIQNDPVAAAKELIGNDYDHCYWMGRVNQKAINDVVNNSGVKFNINKYLGEFQSDRHWGPVTPDLVEYSVTRGDNSLNIVVVDAGENTAQKHLYYRIIEALADGKL